MSVYLSYDVRGIQRFIFAIPKLKAIIGASAAIDQLDQFVQKQYRDQVVFAGGGRGLLEVDSNKTAESIETELCKKAAEEGFDLQIGIDKDLSICLEQADRLHTFIPDTLLGDPCEVSGLYPVSKAGKPHPIIKRRLLRGRSDELGKELIDDLSKDISLPETWIGDRPKFAFFRDVNPFEAAEYDDSDVGEEDHAICGKASIGDRNRWAIVATDVNGLGEQFASAKEQFADNVRFIDWLRKMSDAVSRSVKESLKSALMDVINQWLREHRDLRSCCYRENGTTTLVLPFRPLICGGDDIILLCHTTYAIMLARELCRSVNAKCTERGRSIPNLWPATGLEGPTMSAGVLFCATTMPLASAIDYAKSLLSNAKSAYRKIKPMPAAIDFEMITESLLDTPAERRRRELEFEDIDSGLTMYLYNRPFLLEGSGPGSLEETYQLKEDLIENLPRSLALDLLSQMHKPWSERFEFLSSISKHHPQLFEMFTTMDFQVPGRAWQKNTDASGNWKSYSTCLADAIVLFEEESRMNRSGIESRSTSANRGGN
jgi:hypothetical protein